MTRRSEVLLASGWTTTSGVSRVTVTAGDIGQPYAIDASGAVYDAARAAFRQAWKNEPVDMGMGGSIPFIAEFADAFPAAKILVTGVEDPGTQAHSINESLHLGVLERAATAEALLLAAPKSWQLRYIREAELPQPIRAPGSHHRLLRGGEGAGAAAVLQVGQRLADGLEFGLLLRIGRKVVLHLGPDLVTRLA